MALFRADVGAVPVSVVGSVKAGLHMFMSPEEEVMSPMPAGSNIGYTTMRKMLE